MMFFKEDQNMGTIREEARLNHIDHVRSYIPSYLHVFGAYWRV